MPNEIEAMKSFLEGSNSLAEIEIKIIEATGYPITIVREAIQTKAVAESGNQYAAALKWLNELSSK